MAPMRPRSLAVGNLNRFFSQFGGQLLQQSGRVSRPVVPNPEEMFRKAYAPDVTAKRIICSNLQLRDFFVHLAREDEVFVRSANMAHKRYSSNPQGSVRGTDLRYMEMLAAQTSPASHKAVLSSLYDSLRRGAFTGVLRDVAGSMQQRAAMKAQADKLASEIVAGDTVEGPNGLSGVVEDVSQKGVARIVSRPGETVYEPVADLRKVSSVNARLASRKRPTNGQIRVAARQYLADQRQEEGGISYGEVQPQVLAKVDAVLGSMSINGPYYLTLSGITNSHYNRAGKMEAGIAEVAVIVETPCGHKARFDIPVPVGKNGVGTPSLVMYNRQPMHLTQAAIDGILGPWEVDKWSTPNPLGSPPVEVRHPDVVTGLFDVNPHIPRGLPQKDYGIKR